MAKSKQWNFNYVEGAEYVTCPLDEKNLTTDWLEEFFFNNNCATNPDWNQIAGYGYIEGEQYLCEVEYSNNIVTWQFIHMNYLEEEEILDLAKHLQEFHKDNEHLAFTVRAYYHEEFGYFQNKIEVIFDSKVE